MPITSNPEWRRQPDPPPKSQPSREQVEPPSLRHPPRQRLPRNPTDRDAFCWQKVPKRPQPLRPFCFAPSAPNQPVAVSLVEAGKREDIVFADDRDSPWGNRSRRRWTSLASFVVEIAIVAGLLLLPLSQPQALPRLRSIASVPVLAVPSGRRSRAPSDPQGSCGKNRAGSILLTPQHVPREIPHPDEGEVPPPPDFLGSHAIEAGRGSENFGNSLWRGSGTGPGPYLAPPNPAPSNHPPRISHSMEGSLIHRVQPEYPALAKQARIQGTVLLRAVIDREGKIENLQLVSGHPMLAAAAMKAVQQWRYRPYYLNEQPVEVETLITVHFTLSGG